MKKRRIIILSLFLISILFFSNSVLAFDSKELALKLNRLELMNGDANANGKVDIFDLASIGMYYGAEEGDANWDWKVDIANTVNKIDVFDLAEVGLNYGQNYNQVINDPVFISPSVKNVAQYENFSININISTSANVYALDFVLVFDPSIIKALNITEGGFLSGDDTSIYIVSNIDNSAGRIEFASTRTGTDKDATGNGSLAKVDFRALNIGTTDLDFIEITLIDSSLNEIMNVSAIKGEINVIKEEYPSIIQYNIDNLYISPNDDSIQDDVTIDLEFSEIAKYQIEIVNEGGDTINQWQGTEIDPVPKTWDGKANEQVIEGVYIIKITLEDEDNHITIDESKTIVVDITKPSISNINKIPEPSYNDYDVTLSAEVVDKNLEKVLLEGNWEGTLKIYIPTTEYSYLIKSIYLENQQKVDYVFHASDLAGNTKSSEIMSFIVQNRNPILSIPNQETDEDVKPDLIDLYDYSNDTDGDELTFTIKTQSNSGLISCSISNVHYIDCSTPTLNQDGSSEITVSVSDEIETTEDSFLMIVNSANDLPIANDDSAVTNEDNAISINVLVNDADVEGAVSLDAITIQPAHGTAVINAGKVDYTPNQDYHGTDSFEYRIKDSDNAVNTATVTIIINSINDYPIANNDLVTIDEDNSILIDVLANDVDVDENSLIVNIISQPSYGQADLQNNKIYYKPNDNYFGTDSLEYEVSDGQFTDTAIISITINPINDAPTLDTYLPLDNPIIQEKTTKDFNITASDIDEDVLTIKWYLDGQEVKTGNNYEFLAEHDSQGTYEVKVAVSDTKALLEHVWQLTVEDTYIKIHLTKGNNIFSLPRNEIKSFNELINSFSTNCNIVIENERANLAYYKPSGANISTDNYVFVDLDDILYPGQGYFIKVEDDCYIEMSGPEVLTDDIGYLGSESLGEGWNLIGSTTYAQEFNKGDCQLFDDTGPLKYAFDVNSCNEVKDYDGRYEYCTVNGGITRCRCSFSPVIFEPGLGYWLRTANKCSLA